MYEYLNTLNPAQRSAATHIDGPLLMVAGAGSGKTTTLVNRVAYMVDKGIDPQNILMLTFTNAAAVNMVRKAASLSNEECAKITACTFHSFCALVLRKRCGAVGLRDDFTIITPSEELEAIKLCKSKMKRSEDKEVLKAKDLAEAYSNCINFLKPLSQCVEEMAKSGSETAVAKNMDVLFAYRKYKNENGFVTYDDLLFYMYKLLLIERERNVLEAHYRYVCVDEYQDTNRIQERIAFLLTKKNGNLAVVGDDYQSIYKFRGADVSNIIQFEERARENLGKEVKRVVMDVNYRSVDGILHVANEVMRENARFGFPKVMSGVKGLAALPRLARPVNGEDEAHEILSSIEEWRDEGKNLSEYAVLSRGSKETSFLEVLLTKEGVPYEKLGGLKFLEHQCILDMLSFFKVFVNNSDELSWFHLLDIVPGIGESYASSIVEGIKAGEDPRKWSSKRFYEDLLRLVQFVQNEQSSLGKADVGDMFDETESVYFYFVEKKIRTARLRDEEKRGDMLEQMESDKEIVAVLKGMAVKYETVTEFLDSIVLDAAPQVPTDDKVIVSTIHSAKGLEWEHVDIMNCLAGVLPKNFPLSSDEIKNLRFPEKDEADEELRCLYVALTRAKDSLTCYVPEGLSVAGNFFNKLCPYLESSYEKGLFDCEKGLFKNGNKRYGYGFKYKGIYSGKSVVTSSHKKIYLNVSYYEKDEAKTLGARWDKEERRWYTFEDNPNLGRIVAMFG